MAQGGIEVDIDWTGQTKLYSSSRSLYGIGCWYVTLMCDCVMHIHERVHAEWLAAIFSTVSVLAEPGLQPSSLTWKRVAWFGSIIWYADLTEAGPAECLWTLMVARHYCIVNMSAHFSAIAWFYLRLRFSGMCVLLLCSGFVVFGKCGYWIWDVLAGRIKISALFWYMHNICLHRLLRDVWTIH